MNHFVAHLVQFGMVALAFGATLLPDVGDAQQTGTITLIGTVASNCTIGVTASADATNLDLSGGNKRIEVGTALQNCNKKAGFRLQVQSQNCASGTAGAKLVGSVSEEALRYSVEFNNPPTGGSQSVVTGLLQNACSGTAVVTARDVTNAKITDEISRIYVNYTGDNGLAADAYTDTLTITMVAK